MSKSNLNNKVPICSRPSKQKVTPHAASAAEPKTPYLDPDLLAKISDKACSCEVVARAVRDDVARYIGMSDRRAALIEAMTKSSTTLGCETSEDQIKDGAINNESQNKLDSQSKVLSLGQLHSQSKLASMGQLQSQSKVVSQGLLQSQSKISQSLLQSQSKIMSQGKVLSQGKVMSQGKVQSQSKMP